MYNIFFGGKTLLSKNHISGQWASFLIDDTVPIFLVVVP
jgi:hypothetical protein